MSQLSEILYQVQSLIGNYHANTSGAKHGNAVWCVFAQRIFKTHTYTHVYTYIHEWFFTQILRIIHQNKVQRQISSQRKFETNKVKMHKLTEKYRYL